MPIRIPSHLAELSDVHALKNWVDGKDCRDELWFRSIDQSFEILGRHPPIPESMDEDGAPEELPWDLVVNLLAWTLRREGLLWTYVQKGAQGGISTAEDWFRVCEAAAWRLVQRYNREVQAKRWPPDEH
jgi:hypothetical protein